MPGMVMDINEINHITMKEPVGQIARGATEDQHESRTENEIICL